MAGPSFKHSRNSASTSKCWSFTKPWWSINVYTHILTVLVALYLLDHVGAHPIAIRSGQTVPIATPTPLPKTLTPQQKDFDSFDMTPGLHIPVSNYQQLPSLPDSCATYNNLDGECSTSMVAISVTYDDCDETWILCHCSSADMSIDESVERLGMIPVGLRRYVANTVVLPLSPASNEPHAYTLTNGDIHIFGDCEVESWIHEAVHAYDWMSGEPVSGSRQWLDAVSNDTCTTDNYGTTDSVEAFAQLSILKIFSLIYDRLPAGWESGCMSNQLSFLETLLVFEKSTLFGNTCAIPTPPSSNESSSKVININGLRVGIDPARPIKSIGPEIDPNMPLRVHPEGGPIECDGDEDEGEGEGEGGDSGGTSGQDTPPTSVPPVISVADDPKNGALGLGPGLNSRFMRTVGLMVFGLILGLEVIV